MVRRVILCTIVGLWASAGLLLAAEPRDNESTRDLKQLQGTWEQVSVIIKGVQVPGKEMLIVQDGTMTFMDGDKESMRFDIKLDAVPDPKQINLAVYSNEEEKKQQAAARQLKKLGQEAPDLTPPTMLGIYTFFSDGEQFGLGFRPMGKERPTELSSGKDDDTTLMMFKRVKNGVVGDLKRLQGTWQPTFVFAGAERMQPKHTIVVNGDVMSWLDGEKEDAIFDMKLNSASNPKKIDLTPHLTDEQKKVFATGEALQKRDKDSPAFTLPTILGIYYVGKLKDDNDENFILSFRLPGKERPTEMASKQGDEATLMLFKRGKE